MNNDGPGLGADGWSVVDSPRGPISDFVNDDKQAAVNSICRWVNNSTAVSGVRTGDGKSSQRNDNNNNINVEYCY